MSERESGAQTVLVTKIQKFCTHDGPGIRTTVFFKGCPLRCRWCHNPETHSARPQFFFNEALCIGCGACVRVCPAGAHRMEDGRHVVDRHVCRGCLRCCEACPAGALEACGREMRIDEILRAVESDRAFYGKTGGLTLSGGEPMAHPQAAVSLLSAAKKARISTALETCGQFDSRWVEPLARVTDLFLYDIKDSDEARHVRNTGVGIRQIRENLRLLDELGARVRLRCIMVQGVNMDAVHLSGIAECYHALSHCEGVELIAYHAFAGGKNIQLGGSDNGCREWIPTPAEQSAFARALKQRAVRVIMPGQG